MSGDELRPVDEVLADLLTLAQPLGHEEAPLEAALGRVLVRDVVAGQDLPGFDNAAMDGFAVRADDTAGASASAPVRLELVGGSFAGAPGPPPRVDGGQAATIATGAPLPPGADAVVRVENAVEEGGNVVLDRVVAAGTDVRRRGEDLRKGQTTLSAGVTVGPGQLAAAAGTGATCVLVHRRPRVVVVLTGDEVVPGGSELGDHQVFDAVGPALSGLLVDAGAGQVERRGPVGDDREGLTRVLSQAAAESDLVVTVGGVSKGQRDHLADVLSGLGTVRGGAVALRPGKPFRYGRIGDTVVTCLPGNPGAALVAFEVFVRPVVTLQSGADPSGAEPLRATLAVPFTQPPGRRHWVRAEVTVATDGRTVRPVGAQGSAMLHSLAAANAWMVVGPGVERLDAGAQVEVHPMWGDRGRTSWVRA